MVSADILALGFFFGVVFGIIIQRMSFCLATDLSQAFAGAYRRILIILLTIFVISGTGFHILGPTPVGQLRGYGLYNILAGIFFGVGIVLSGGCVLGTLRRIGEGFIHSIIVFISWLGGMALVVYKIDPILWSTYKLDVIERKYGGKNMILAKLLGISNPWYTFIPLAIIAIAILIKLAKEEGVGFLSRSEEQEEAGSTSQ